MGLQVWPFPSNPATYTLGSSVVRNIKASYEGPRKNYLSCWQLGFEDLVNSLGRERGSYLPRLFQGSLDEHNKYIGVSRYFCANTEKELKDGSEACFGLGISQG